MTAIVIGAGLRGRSYAYFAEDFPSRLKITGVAEFKPHRLEEMKKSHNIPDHLAVKGMQSSLIHSADPESRPVVIIVFTYVVCTNIYKTKQISSENNVRYWRDCVSG